MGQFSGVCALPGKGGGGTIAARHSSASLSVRMVVSSNFFLNVLKSFIQRTLQYTRTGEPRQPDLIRHIRYWAIHCEARAHGVVVSHPLSMREALGSIPSLSIDGRQAKGILKYGANFAKPFRVGFCI